MKLIPLLQKNPNHFGLNKGNPKNELKLVFSILGILYAYNFINALYVLLININSF